MSLRVRILVVLALALCLYAVMLLVTVPHLRELAGGLVPLDLRSGGYTLAEAQALFDALGEQGRSYYLLPQLLIDFVYPATMAVALGLMLHVLVPARRWVAFLPAIPAAFDYLENILILVMLRGYPDLSASLVAVASTATIVKAVSLSLCVALVVVLFLWLRVRPRLRRS